VLEGSVRRSGKRVRIAAQLIDVTNGYHLWSERYDREIEDVFAVQDEIATAIAERMKASMKAGRAAIVEQRSTQSIEAYETYLKARALLYRRGPVVKQGMALMVRALELDPTYGLAWAGLADSFSILGYYSQLSAEDAGTEARGAAIKALELAPDLGEAHTARGMVHLLYDWDFEASKKEFTLGLRLNPGILQGAAWYFLFDVGYLRGKWDQTFSSLLELEKREPLSGYVAAILGVAHSAGGTGEESKRWARRAMELDPEAFLSLWTMSLAYHRNKEWSKAIEAGEVALAASGRQPLALTTFAMSLFESGQLDSTRAVYDEMRSRSRREPFTPTSLAFIAAALGDRQAAVDYTHEAVRVRDPQLPIFHSNWDYARFLRAMPEFQEIVRGLKFPGW
jgi:tetratricopeptide (TPR) repeat protein